MSKNRRQRSSVIGPGARTRGRAAPALRVHEAPRARHRLKPGPSRGSDDLAGSDYRRRYTHRREQHGDDRAHAEETVRRRSGSRPRAREAVRQRRAEADRARVRSAESGGGAGAGSSRGPDSPGVLLRHAEARAQRRGRGRAGAEDPGKGRGLGGQAATGRSRRAAGEPAQVSRPRRRGRRDARRLRVLGGVERQDGRPCRQACRCWRSPDSQALLEGAASVLRRQRRGRCRAGRAQPCWGRSSFSS